MLLLRLVLRLVPIYVIGWFIRVISPDESTLALQLPPTECPELASPEKCVLHVNLNYLRYFVVFPLVFFYIIDAMFDGYPLAKRYFDERRLRRRAAQARVGARARAEGSNGTYRLYLPSI